MIYYDITDILEYGRSNATLSGIQRVSVAVINHVVNTYEPESIQLIGYHPDKGDVVTFPSNHFEGIYIYDQIEFCSYFGVRVVSGSEKWHPVNFDTYVALRYGKKPKARLHSLRLNLLNFLTSGDTFKKRKIIPGVEERHFDRSNRPVISDGDLIYIPGATWNMNVFLDFLEDASAKGARVVQFIHDLIPLVTPEHVVDDVHEHFLEWLLKMSSVSNTFIANSKSTENDLRVFLRNMDLSNNVKTVPLAHEFLFTQSDIDDENTSLRRKLSLMNRDLETPLRIRVVNAARLPFVLVVGTLESRKNAWGLAQLWKALLEELGPQTPRLIFAGKHGWLKDDFDDFIASTGGLGGYIRILERPTDEELIFLYKRCEFSICASFYEGWGLPIGEAMWFGKAVASSNTSSMPEVGQDLIDYFDPYDFEDMLSVVRRLVTDVDYRKKRALAIERSQLRTWSDVSEDIWKALKEIEGDDGQIV